MTRKEGIVAWFNVAKGYGEILSNNKEVFFFTYLHLEKKERVKNTRKGKKISFSVLNNKTVFNLPVASKIREIQWNYLQEILVHIDSWF